MTVKVSYWLAVGSHNSAGLPGQPACRGDPVVRLEPHQVTELPSAPARVFYPVTSCTESFLLVFLDFFFCFFSLFLFIFLIYFGGGRGGGGFGLAPGGCESDWKQPKDSVPFVYYSVGFTE